jgi:hypothetical protein
MILAIGAEGRLQCPVDCHTEGRDEYGTVHRVFRGPDPRAAASLGLNRRPRLVSWLSQAREWVRAHRSRLRIFFLPKCSPELNPDEQVWNEIKNNKLGKQPIKNKRDLKKRLYSALRSLQRHRERIRSFFQLPDTLYASMNIC